MPESRIFARNREGKKALLAQCHFPSTEIVELAAIAGLDGIDLDGEHGHFTLSEIDEICRVANGYGLTVTARVPAIDTSIITAYLARGVQGIQGPHLETREQAQLLADACLFKPEGDRSWGPARGNHYGHEGVIADIHRGNVEFMRDANQNMLVIGQIESQKGIDNLDEILKVKGLDCITFGPNDLCASLGHPGEPNHPAVKAAHADIEKRTRAAGKRLLSDRLLSIRVTVHLLDGFRDYVKKFGNEAARV